MSETTQQETSRITNTFQESTMMDSSQSPSTQISSSSIPSSLKFSTTQESFTMTTQSTTSPPSSCVYVVPNCEFCDRNPPSIDLNQVNVSCCMVGGSYEWILKSKSNGTITNNAVFVVNGTTYTQEEEGGGDVVD